MFSYRAYGGCFFLLFFFPSPPNEKIFWVSLAIIGQPHGHTVKKPLPVHYHIMHLFYSRPTNIPSRGSKLTSSSTLN
jgi:hypothetical protein